MIDWSACPVVERVPGRRGGLPVIRRSRVRPEDLLENVDQGAEWLAASHELALDDVQAVLAFYERCQGRLAPAS